MNAQEIQVFIPAVKDSASERPIPSAWRPVFKQIVSALAKHDYQLSKGIAELARRVRREGQTLNLKSQAVLPGVPLGLWLPSLLFRKPPDSDPNC